MSVECSQYVGAGGQITPKSILKRPSGAQPRVVPTTPSWKIIIPDKPILRATYDRAAKSVRAGRDYSDRQHSAPGVTDHVATHIRRIVLKEKIISRQAELRKITPDLARRYTAGDNIAQLATEFDHSPLAVFRAVVGHHVDTTKLAGRDLEQFREASALDAESAVVQRRIADEAATAENEFVAKLRSLGVGMRTQDDLVAEQVAAYGRAVCTPDVLFTDKVWVNGRRIFWIDFKNYTATPARFLLESNRDQAGRYFARFGPGALAYGAGVVAGVTTGAMMLDASDLDAIRLG